MSTARLRRAIDRHNATEARRQGLVGAAAAQASGIIVRGGSPEVVRRLVAAGYRFEPRRPGAGTGRRSLAGGTSAPVRMHTHSWADTAEARRPRDPLADVGRPRQPLLPVTEAARAAARRALGVHRLPWEPPDPSEP